MQLCYCTFEFVLLFDVQVGVSAVCLLGYNVNQGQEISLRLRTDDLKGDKCWGSLDMTLSLWLP